MPSAVSRVRPASELAPCLLAVRSQGVERRVGMEKALLRRDGHEEARSGDQNWLAQLVVPRAERQPLALETGDEKILASHEGCDRVGISASRAYDCFAYAAHGEPSGVVARCHPAAGKLAEA